MKLIPIGFDAVNEPVTLTDERKNHHHIIGASGSGKSKFLEQMIRADLRSGQGFCLIDPHGSLYHDVLNYCAYHVFEREIILLNLSDPQYVVGFDFFSKNPTGDVSVQVDNRISATLHAWGVENADQTPTLERILRLVYTTLIDADLSLPETAALLSFSEKAFREKTIARIKNDFIRNEWEELSSLTKARDFRDEIISAKNRLFRLLTSETLMRFLGVKGKTIDLYETMNEGKIILVNLALSENLSRENARVFGSLLVNQFFEAALRRDSKNNPKPYYLYLDEFQNFVSLDLCNMLDEVRKFALFLNISHQRFGHLDEDIEDAILTNCRIKTVFGGLRADDAKRMAEEMFIGKLDPKKIKAAIYQTKHWYKYTRDKVYSHSVTYSESEGHSTSQGDSFGSGSGHSSGSNFADASGSVSLPVTDDLFTGATWFDIPQIKTTSESHSGSFSDIDSYSNSYSESNSSTDSHSTSKSETEGFADVPVFVPVPFQELSSVQYYTLEEQLLELTQALKLNQQRRCFIQLPEKETQPLLIPFVEDFSPSKKNFDWFINWIAQKNSALTLSEVDKILEDSSQIQLLLQETGDTEKPPANPAQKEIKKENKSIFDRIKEANPNLDI